ncbi:MAG: DNA replication/repair protein RecF [Candidatus Dormibacteraeota bacterium]|nr:DNA replication/repair protein RecF [Candidatus Dormibacteraeota bacterium]MBV9526083.1 DNA replication/repair protein RecF [Candidatus Dormibacteraeota bacterium]
MITTLPACTVARLRLHNFRNYHEATLHLEPGLTVISGRNAQGKTNLLEAVATLALTRSPRAVTAADLLRWGTNGAQVEADILRPGGPAALALRLEQPATGTIARRTLVDGKPRAARAVLGLCPVVLFWPDDLQLVKAGPEGRRRLLDVLLAQLDGRAASHLLRYRRVLEQRNALLHRLRADGGSPAALHGFTRELAHHGARVLVARNQLASKLAPLAAAAMSDLSGGDDTLSIRYAASHGGDLADDDAAERDLLAALERRTPDEIARGVTLVGPHRDDLVLSLGGREARYTASQGQQRSIVLACKIAEMRHVAEEKGMSPVVMLDDVVSELDAPRRRHLLSTLAAAPAQQVLLTSTERVADTSEFAAVHHLTVSAGTVGAGR